MSKLLPLGDYVLIDAVETVQTTKSGIILPESKDKPSKWKVVSVGPGKVLDSGNMSPINVKEGDVVSVRERSKSLEIIADSVSRGRAGQYSWIEFDASTLTAKFLNRPSRQEIPENINEQLIVELYSK